MSTYKFGTEGDVNNFLGAGVKVKTIAFVFNDNTETDTGWDLPADSALLDIVVEVTTVDATETINIGLFEGSSEEALFVSAASLASATWVRPASAITTGTNVSYYSSNTRGTGLSTYVAGTDASYNHGLYTEKPYYTDSSSNYSVGYTCSAGSDTAAGNIHILYVDMNT